jgi:hypothetical protein
MTIITGSSCPYSAVALSQKPIYIASVPQAGTSACYYLPQAATRYVVHNLNKNGELNLRSRVDFKSVIADQLKANKKSA